MVTVRTGPRWLSNEAKLRAQRAAPQNAPDVKSTRPDPAESCRSPKLGTVDSSHGVDATPASSKLPLKGERGGSESILALESAALTLFTSRMVNRGKKTTTAFGRAQPHMTETRSSVAPGKHAIEAEGAHSVLVFDCILLVAILYSCYRLKRELYDRPVSSQAVAAAPVAPPAPALAPPDTPPLETALVCICG